jgi:IclR family pca regulon transcriptional regulator
MSNPLGRGARRNGDRPLSDSGKGLANSQFSLSLAKGLAVLRSFTPQQPMLAISDIADEQKMTSSTAHRYATTLAALGYLQQDAQRTYELAAGAGDLGSAALRATPLVRAARPELERLRSETGWTIALAVLDGAGVLYLNRLRSHRMTVHDLALPLGPGSKLPAYCTATGKALLAQLSEAELRKAIAATELSSRGPRSITTKKALREQLAHVRETGVAIADEELQAGVRSIAAPIYQDDAVVAAVGLDTASTAHTTASLAADLGPMLVECAAGISAQLNGARSTGDGVRLSAAGRGSATL